MCVVMQDDERETDRERKAVWKERNVEFSCCVKREGIKAFSHSVYVCVCVTVFDLDLKTLNLKT